MGIVFETRLAIICATIVGCYGLLVSLAAARLGLPSSINITGLWSIYIVWVVAFAFVFIVYSLDLVLRRRPVRPLRAFVEDFRQHVLRPELLLARSTIVMTISALFIFFSPCKVMIPKLNGFAYDELFAKVDRILFFGRDPWVVTHALFGTAWATMLLQLLYDAWFFLMWFSMIYIVMRPERVDLRARYIIAFPLCWITVGSIAAVMLSAAGPCFYENVVGAPDYRPLLARLHLIDNELQALAPGFGIHSLGLQELLWRARDSDSLVLGAGVSAMPSMHVASAVLLALAGFRLSHKLGWILSINALLIWIGSIHLAWHYAVDGLVAFVLTIIVWRFSGALVDWLTNAAAPTWRQRLALVGHRG